MIVHKIELACDLCTPRRSERFTTEKEAAALGWIACSNGTSHICPICAAEIDEYLRNKRRKDQNAAYAKATSEQFGAPSGESAK